VYDSLTTTGSWHGENIHFKKSGEEIYVESSVSVLKDESGTAIGLLAVVRDITQRKQTDEKIREQASLLDKAQDAIGVRDLGNHLIYGMGSTNHELPKVHRYCMKNFVFHTKG
jgi:PAS domain-containing protein